MLSDVWWVIVMWTVLETKGSYRPCMLEMV